jgi:hypothetical protein
MWRSEAGRSQHSAGAISGPLTPPVLAAWRLAYDTRRPSRKQIEVLSELTGRRGAPWVTARLRAEYPDPFGALLELDQGQRRSDIEAILVRERVRDEERQAESLGFQSLGQIILALRPPEG